MVNLLINDKMPSVRNLNSNLARFEDRTNSTSQKMKLAILKKILTSTSHFLNLKLTYKTYKNITILITVFLLDNSLNGTIWTTFLSFSTFHSFSTNRLQFYRKQIPQSLYLSICQFQCCAMEETQKCTMQFFLNKGPHLKLA